MRHSIVLASILALTTACVPQKQWRSKPVLTTGSTAPADPEDGFYLAPDSKEKRIYSLSFVEFGNDGHFRNPQQIDEALTAIDRADQRSNHHALIVVFVHGWKNNAGKFNNNVLDFRRQLNRIAREVCGASAETCGVAGIYFGWNGDQVKQEWGTLRQASIFNRRGVARQVAGGDVGQGLLKVMKHVKEGQDHEGNLSIVVGHSFGALILEAAITDKMKQVGRELSSQIKRGTNVESYTSPILRELADLIVLINAAVPAVEAVNLLAEYRQELQRVHFLLPPREPQPPEPKCAPNDTRQDCKSLAHPLLLAVSSESDLATNLLLPISERISPSKLKLNPGVEEQLPKGLDAKKLSSSAAAHTPQLHSHHLVECDGGDCSPCLKRDKYYIPIRIKNLPAFARGNETRKDMPLNYCLERRDSTAWNQTPFWVFNLPTKIVPDHSEIFTDRFTDFLTAFLPPLRKVESATAAPIQATRKSEAGR